MTTTKAQASNQSSTKCKIFYRVMRGNEGFYDRLIRWYSRSPYTHSEFCWPLDNPHPSQYLGAQTKGGVQKRPANYLGNQPFDVFSVEVTLKQKAQIEAFLTAQIGKPYDFRAIEGMVIQAFDHGKILAAWFCSELLYYALASVGINLLRIPMKQSDRITPRDTAISPIAHLEFSSA